MKRPLIIGYGNSLREDDAVGLRAAELVTEALPDGTAEIIETHQLTPELAHKIAAASVVIFLDAAVDQQAGSVLSRRVDPQALDAWTHHSTAAQLLGMARQLAGTVPPAFLISGGVNRTGWSERLSPAAETTASEMAASAVRILNKKAG